MSSLDVLLESAIHTDQCYVRHMKGKRKRTYAIKKEATVFTSHNLAKHSVLVVQMVSGLVEEEELAAVCVWP